MSASGRLQGARGHRRQVRLEQDVVERLGQERGEQPGGGGGRDGLLGRGEGFEGVGVEMGVRMVVVVDREFVAGARRLGRLVRCGGGAEQGPALGRQCPSSRDAQRLRLGQGPAGEPGAQVLVALPVLLRAARRTLPVQPGQHGLDGRGGALRERGQQGQHPVPYLRRGRPVQARAEGGQRTVLGVPAADHSGRPGRRQPRLGEPCPALRRGPLQPLVVRGGRRVPLVGLAVGRQQACRVGEFDPEGGHRFGHVQGHGRPLEVADAQPAGPQHGRAALVPVLQQLLDGRERGVRLPGRRVVHNLWTMGRGVLDPGRQRLGRAVRPAVAQMQGHFTGEHDGAGCCGQEQPPVQQPAQVCGRARR